MLSLKRHPYAKWIGVDLIVVALVARPFVLAIAVLALGRMFVDR